MDLAQIGSCQFNLGSSENVKHTDDLAQVNHYSVLFCFIFLFNICPPELTYWRVSDLKDWPDFHIALSE